MNAFRNGSCALLAAMAVAVMIAYPAVSVSADEPNAVSTSPPNFRTATAAHADLMQTISATGTIEPEDTVDVGSQVTGPISKLGSDLDNLKKTIDWCSRVEEGTLLAQIDDEMYRAQVDHARAGCLHADAEVTQAKAKVALAKVQWQHAQELIKTNAISASDLDLAKCTYEVAQAAVGVAEASSVQSKAVLQEAMINLSRTSIKSPIRGVVVDRRVSVGQTVVSTMSSTSLFLIAKDLKKLQVWTSVNEADIGQIREQQAAHFTVDAFSGRSFEGNVIQIRHNATMLQNVVTYTVVVAVDNSDGKLLPYLTANVQFEVGRRQNVLAVSNTALRWRPQPQWIVPEAREKARQQQEPHRIWIQDGQFVRPIAVQVGLSDGVMTEIIAGDVKEGMEIIVGVGAATTDRGHGATTRPSSISSQLLRGLSVGSAAKEALQRAIASLGINLLLVMPGTASSGGVSTGSDSTMTLTAADAVEIARQCPAVCQVAPLVRSRAQIVYGGRNWVPYVIYGTTPSYLSLRDWEEFAEGAAFTDVDVRNGNKVCLIGETLRRELFQGGSPIGEQIRIQNVAFKVVGVLNRKGVSIFGLDQDDIVLAPWTTIKYRVSSQGTGNQGEPAGASTREKTLSNLYPAAATLAAAPTTTVDQILTQAATTEQVPQAIDEITQLLRERHRIGPDRKDDFYIRDMNELLRAMVRRG